MKKPFIIDCESEEKETLFLKELEYYAAYARQHPPDYYIDEDGEEDDDDEDETSE